MNVCMPRKATQGLSGFGKTKTQAHLVKFCDINYMISRAVSGDSSVFRKGFYGDATIVPESLQECLNLQLQARYSFEALPPEVRSRFGSSESFLAFVSDPANSSELVKLGLAIEIKPDEPSKVIVVKDESVNPDGVKASKPQSAPSAT